MKKIEFKHLQQRITWQNLIVAIITILAMLIGCSHTEKVLVPPKVELNAYNKIGVIEFSTNAEDDVKQYVTQNFIQYVQSAQPGTRILELGSQEQVLGSIRRNELDFETIKTIGEKYHVDAVIFGHLQVSEIKPKVKVLTVPKSVHATAYIQALLSTRLLETDSGATLWTNATTGKISVANVNVIEKGLFNIGISDPKEKYGKLVPELVYLNTMDFRAQYEYRKVK